MSRSSGSTAGQTQRPLGQLQLPKSVVMQRRMTVVVAHHNQTTNEIFDLGSIRHEPYTIRRPTSRSRAPFGTAEPRDMDENTTVGGPGPVCRLRSSTILEAAMTSDDGSLYDDRPDEEYGTGCRGRRPLRMFACAVFYALGQVNPESHRAWSSDIDLPETEALCGCDCHRDCPLVTEELGRGEWLSRCTCNGALQMIDRYQRMPPSTFSPGPVKVDIAGNMREALDKTRRKRTARRATEERRERTHRRRGRADSPGRVAPPRTRHSPPGDRQAHRRRDRGAARSNGAGSSTARLFRDLAGLPIRLRRVTRGVFRDPERIGRRMGAAFDVATGKELVEIPLRRGRTRGGRRGCGSRRLSSFDDDGNTSGDTARR